MAFRIFVRFSGAILAALLLAAPSPSLADRGSAEEIQTLLSMSIEELMELEVVSVSSGRAGSVPKAPGIVSVIPAASIEAMPARFLTDILKTLPGFDVRQANNGKLYVSSVGVDNPASVLVMIDGVHFNDPFSGGAIYDIPVDNIARLEIIRGPGSALYGASAMMAVINVVTKRRPETRVKAGLGTFNTGKASLEYGDRREDVSWRVFGEVYDTAGADGVMESDMLLARGMSRAPMAQKDNRRNIWLQGALDHGAARLNATYFSQDRGPNFAWHAALSDKGGSMAEYGALDLANTYTLAGAAVTPKVFVNRWRRSWDIQLFPDGYTDNRDLDNDGDVERFPDGVWQKKTYTVDTAGAGLTLERAFGAHRLTAGASGETQELRDTSFATNYLGDPLNGAVAMGSFANWNNYALPQKSRSLWAAFVQDDWTGPGGLNVVAGVRHDQYSDFGGATAPRVAAVYPLAERITLKAQYAASFRAPTLEELYDETDPQFSGNPDLMAEKMEGYEASVWYHYGASNHLAVSAYRHRLRDYITNLFNVTMAVANQNENAGELDITGYAVEARHAVTPYSWITANATLFNAKDVTSDSWLTAYPQLRANAGVNVSLPYRITVTLWWLYSDTAHTNARIDSEAFVYNKARRGPTHLLNLAVASARLPWGLTAKASVFNLLNHDYREIYTDTRDRLQETPVVYENDNRIPNSQRMFLLELSKEF